MHESEIGQLGYEVRSLRQLLSAHMQQTSERFTAVHEEINELRTEMRAGFIEMRTEMRASFAQMGAGLGQVTALITRVIERDN